MRLARARAAASDRGDMRGLNAIVEQHKDAVTKEIQKSNPDFTSSQTDELVALLNPGKKKKKRKKAKKKAKKTIASTTVDTTPRRRLLTEDMFT